MPTESPMIVATAEELPSWELHKDAWFSTLQKPIVFAALLSAILQTAECLCSSNGECSLPPVHRGDHDSLISSACQPICDALDFIYGGFGSARHKAVFSCCSLLLLYLLTLCEALILKARSPYPSTGSLNSGSDALSAQQAYGALSTDSPLLQGRRKNNDDALASKLLLITRDAESDDGLGSNEIPADAIHDLGFALTRGSYRVLLNSSTCHDCLAAVHTLVAAIGPLSYCIWCMNVDAGVPGEFGWKPFAGAVLLLFVFRFFCGASTQLPVPPEHLASPLDVPRLIERQDDGQAQRSMVFFSPATALLVVCLCDAHQYVRRAPTSVFDSHS